MSNIFLKKFRLKSMEIKATIQIPWGVINGLFQSIVDYKMTVLGKVIYGGLNKKCS